MRRAIEQDAARPGSLIGECLEVARARELSEEETYVFLAYQALLRLEEGLVQLVAVDSLLSDRVQDALYGETTEPG